MQKITFFQAANLSDNEVIAQFVARKKELDRILSEIRQDDMTGSIQHYILVGQRGSGKSTLLRRLQAAVNTEPAINERLIAINLSEEQAGIYRLHDLWERVCDELRVKGLDVNDVDWASYDGDFIAYARALYEAMQHALKKADKKLVLLLDNIDRVLENIKTDDNHLFREQLMNHKDVRIIGGSTRLSEHHWKYDEPFYQFFQIIRLLPLSEEEMKELLLYWADFMKEPKLKDFIAQGTGKLNAVRILSDGMPRTMLHLVDLLINRPEEHGYEYLRYIIDRATPIYQERLATLSTQHQKIVLELSFFWDATHVKDLVHAVKMDSKTVSAALHKLVELEIVEKRKGTGKNMLYLLKERFFNLWLIMTQGGPKEKSRVKWFTMFLETWYGPEEMRSLYSNFNENLCSGRLKANQAVIMVKALVHSKLLSLDERDSLLDNISSVIEGNTDYQDMLPIRSREAFHKAVDLVVARKFDRAFQVLDDIEQDNGIKHSIKGLAYYMQGEMMKAEREYITAIDKEDYSALNNVANIYSDTGQLEKAEEYYLKASEKGFIGATYNLALLYDNRDAFDKAEEYYRLAIASNMPSAMFDLAFLYDRNGYLDKAETYYLKAITNSNDMPDYLATIHKSGVGSNRAVRYNLESIEHARAEAMHRLATLYATIHQFNDSIQYYIQAIQLGHKEAVIGLGIVYYQSTSNIQSAKKLFEEYLLDEPSGLSLNHRLFRLNLGVWTGYPEVLSQSNNLIEEALKGGHEKILIVFFNSLLIHYQENTLWEYFHNSKFGEELQIKLKPLYFSTAKLLNNEHAKETLLTLPTELVEIVDAVIDAVNEGRETHYGK